MKLTSPVCEDFWWQVARCCDYATFFHTPLWHQLAVKTYPGYQVVSVGAEFENGARAVLPLLECPGRIRWISLRHSTFAGCYGGPITDGTIQQMQMLQLCQAGITWRTKQLRVLSNPIAPDTSFEPVLHNCGEDFTHILDLTEGYDAVASRFADGHRRSIRKGRRMGVSVREASTQHDYQEYFRTYQDSLRRWGHRASSRYPWALFEHGWQIAKQHPQCLTLWVAEFDGRIVAGALVLYWNRHAVYWHGAALEEYLSHKPSNVLQDTIIRDACERGYRFYDFNPSGGHEGVARFKRHHGAQERPLVRWEWHSPLFRLRQRVNSVVGPEAS